MEITQSLELLTEETLAKRLAVSLACLRRWRVERRGPVFVRVGRLVRYRQEDIQSWIAKQPRGGGESSNARLLSGFNKPGTAR